MSTRQVQGGSKSSVCKIYLAGGFYADYKKFIIERLTPPGFLLLDPEDMPKSYPGDFVSRDFAAIDSADLVLAYLDEYPHVYGMAAEVGYAVAKNKPVIFVTSRKRVDSFLSACAKATFTDVVPALDFIEERYGRTT